MGIKELAYERYLNSKKLAHDERLKKSKNLDRDTILSGGWARKERDIFSRHIRKESLFWEDSENIYDESEDGDEIYILEIVLKQLGYLSIAENLPLQITVGKVLQKLEGLLTEVQIMKIIRTAILQTVQEAKYSDYQTMFKKIPKGRYFQENQSKHKQIPCKKCKGAGYIDCYHYYNSISVTICNKCRDTRRIYCENCGGTGKIMVIEQEPNKEG